MRNDLETQFILQEGKLSHRSEGNIHWTQHEQGADKSSSQSGPQFPHRKIRKKKNNKKNNPFTLFSTSPDHPEQRPLHLIKNLIGITDTAVTNVVQLNVAQTRSTFQQRSHSLTSELLPSGQKQKNQGNQETLTQSTGEKLS